LIRESVLTGEPGVRQESFHGKGLGGAKWDILPHKPTFLRALERVLTVSVGKNSTCPTGQKENNISLILDIREWLRYDR
jgi:hypothetical protein